jgi:DNA invertase Pin-like site-specific DNA recombinase
MTTTIPKEIITLDPKGIDFGDSEAVKALILKLLNIIESQAQFNEELQNENQSLKDEINRLKGEKGKPKFPPKTAEKEEDIPSLKAERKKNWSVFIRPLRTNYTKRNCQRAYTASSRTT